MEGGIAMGNMDDEIVKVESRVVIIDCFWLCLCEGVLDLANDAKEKLPVPYPIHTMP
jgi:hypothetical protein